MHTEKKQMLSTIFVIIKFAKGKFFSIIDIK